LSKNYHPNRWLIAILIAHLFVGTLYATQTPAWQAPDEPAHYNYIAHIAHGNGLPVLAMGDFDLAYNSELISQKFLLSMSVEPMRYESYQPPLYYLVATPIYGLFAGFEVNNTDGRNGEPYGIALIALRLFGVLLATISLGLLYACAATIFPARPMLSIGAAAFAAALPMHAAMTASVNNDTLAELLILASVLILLRWMKQRLIEAHSTQRVANQKPERNLLFMLGLLLGLGLLTKIYVYALLPICLFMVLLITWRTTGVDRVTHAISNVGWVLTPALLIALPMWIRNMWLYGITDPLGLAWHDLVVAGQPTLLDWIAQYGWPAYWERAFSFTFRSFWGVFGWLSIFLDERVYTLLTIGSGVVAFGLLWAILRTLLPGSKRTRLNEFQRWSLLFLGLMLLAVFACYGLYNLKFVQHQGRYLFWGLLPISLLVAVGGREVQRVRVGVAASALVISLTLWLSSDGLRYLSVDMVDKWTLLIGSIVTIFLLLQSLLRREVNRTILSVSNRLPLWFHLVPNKAFRHIYVLFSTLPFLLLFILSIVTILFTIRPILSPF